MFKFAAIGVACLALSTALPTMPEMQNMFDSYLVRYSKVYATQEEYNLRFRIFRDNLATAEALTAQGTSQHGVTKFMDLSPEEFKAMYLTFRKGNRTMKGDPAPVSNKRLGAPSAVDWRTKGVVTPVKDQGQCGSCWAFSTVEEIETDWIMAGNSMVELSPQQIVSCDTTDQGCNGGDTVTAYAYVQSAGGLETEADYPYTSGSSSGGPSSGSGSNPPSGSGSGSSTVDTDASCQFNQADVVVTITGFAYGTKEGDETTMQNSVATLGPMSICLATGGWQTYTSGILTASTCGTSVDHCVQVVGYNTGGSGGDYWIVRNSWNTDWGISGYIYLALGTNTCDLTGEVTYVHTAKAA